MHLCSIIKLPQFLMNKAGRWEAAWEEWHSSSPGTTHGMGVLKGSGLALGHGAAWALARVALTLHILLHASLLHAEGDLGVLVAEQDVCNTRGWIARGV